MNNTADNTDPQTATYLVDVPQRFYDDHCSRDLDAADTVRVKVLARTYRLRMTVAALDELRSDAAYYADEADAFGFENAGLCKSAAATVRAIDKVDRPSRYGTATPTPAVEVEVEIDADDRKAYNAGWRYAINGTGGLDYADNAGKSDAWYDGYLDLAAGREKFHLPKCRASATGCPEHPKATPAPVTYDAPPAPSGHTTPTLPAPGPFTTRRDPVPVDNVKVTAGVVVPNRVLAALAAVPFPVELFVADGGGLDATVWIEGAAWNATGGHSIVVHYFTDRPAGWDALVEDIGEGVSPCIVDNCDTCDPPVAVPTFAADYAFAVAVDRHGAAILRGDLVDVNGSEGVVVGKSVAIEGHVAVRLADGAKHSVNPSGVTVLRRAS